MHIMELLKIPCTFCLCRFMSINNEYEKLFKGFVGWMKPALIYSMIKTVARENVFKMEGNRFLIRSVIFTGPFEHPLEKK